MNNISNRHPTVLAYNIENVSTVDFKKDSTNDVNIKKNQELKEIISLGQYSIDIDKLSTVLSNNI